MVKVKYCGCKGYKGVTHAAEYQDAKYGTGYRLYNKMKSKGGEDKYRCTVCGSIIA